ncbi:hypothetical protein [Microcoleus sp. bin38.metabat.b11b12b14.051]|uniref:hypothetical protein n=1 Tax=Microcoleus sp. bin38.metabat.b11b12b14.051 TaxID=2742709 RepID=UPI0025F786DC|nr:hypothetical protein [Microcoleus sp. bin38.metabat.b11b12b14.051]
MYILFNGNLEKPEIEISDSSQGLIQMGQLLPSISKDFKLYASKEKSEFYAENLEAVSMRLFPSRNGEELDLLTTFMANNELVFEGSKLAFNNLGISLLNFFSQTSKKGDHFHLDYIEGYSLLLAPTNCHLIFMCTG